MRNSRDLSQPQTLLGELTPSPDLLGGFKGPTSNGRGEKERRREGEGNEGVVRLPHSKFLDPSLHRCRAATHVSVVRDTVGEMDNGCPLCRTPIHVVLQVFS